MSKYIPFSEMEAAETDPVIWRVNLPEYVPANEIGINLRRLGRLARLSGFESLRVASYDGEVTKLAPGIDSVGQDGSATASMPSAVSKAETSRQSIHGQTAPELPLSIEDYTWTNGALLLNTSEIDGRVGQKGNVRDANVWAKELNAALTKGMRAMVAKNLIERPSMFHKITAPLPLAASLIVIDAQYVNDFSAQTLIELGLIGIPLLHTMFEPAYEMIVHKFPPNKRRWSLVPGVQLDRVLAVNSLSRISPLVKHLEQRR